MNLHDIPTRTMPPFQTPSEMALPAFDPTTSASNYYTTASNYYTTANSASSYVGPSFPSGSLRVQREIDALLDRMIALGMRDGDISRLAYVVSPQDYRAIQSDPAFFFGGVHSELGGMTIYGIRVVPLP